MSEVRWSRAICFGVAAFVIALGVALLPVAWSAYREYAATLISPLIASPADLKGILSAILSQVQLDGMPPPPPPPPLFGKQQNPNTPAEFVAAIEHLLPEIASLHANLAILLREAYLPVLKGTPIVWTPRPEPSTGDNKKVSAPRKKSKHYGKARVRRARVGLPGREKPLPGESLEETEES